MALKKSELYSSLWSSCDELRGGMDASQNEFNLNLPRYIDSQTPDDIQDIEGHLKGGIPAADVDALRPYWADNPNARVAIITDRDELDKQIECVQEHPSQYRSG